MTGALVRDEDWQHGLEAFLREFFATPGNDAWPDLSPKFRWADRVEPFVEIARRVNDIPLVLPRMVSTTDSYALYVIVPNKAETVQIAELIMAFAGPTYSRLPRAMQPSALDVDDAVDSAVLRFFGPGTTFKVQTSSRRADRQNLTDALRLMQETLARRPNRPRSMVKPAGRLLAEFDAAVAAGSESTSADLLDQLAAAGGLDASNLAYLRIKRLSRLGKDAEVLALPRLADIARQAPPTPVRDAVLAATYFAVIEDLLTAGDLDAACIALRSVGDHVPAFMRGDLERLSAESIAVLAVASVVRDDETSLLRIIDAAQSSGRFDSLPEVLRQRMSSLGPVGAPTTEPAADGELSAISEQTDIQSWLEFVKAVAAGDPRARQSVEENAWESWDPPAEHDASIAHLLDDLPTEQANRVWAAAGSFIDAVGYARPAGLSARAFIRNALTFDRFSPADLLALQALIEITLRRAPDGDDYAELLADIGAESRRWVALDQAGVVLDIVDTLVLAACPDPSSRQNLAIRLLSPLAQHAARLDDAQLAVARLLTRELDLGFQWITPDFAGRTEDQGWRNAELSLLLYSLDGKVLARAAQQLNEIVPHVDVVITSDHVGSPQLKQRVRHADIVVMVTRCATHAATGFIGQHAGADKIVFVEGSGSASVLRTALAEIRKRTER